MNPNPTGNQPYQSQAQPITIVQPSAPVIVQPSATAPNQYPDRPSVPAVSQPFIAQMPTAPEIRNQGEATTKGSTVKKAMLRTAMVVALLAAFVGGYAGNGVMNDRSQRNAAKQARAFLTSLNKGDTKTAYAMTSANLHKQQTQTQFGEAIGDVKTSQPTFEDQDISFSGSTAQYSVAQDGLEPTDDGSTVGAFNIVMVKSGLVDWKVDSVNVE